MSDLSIGYAIRSSTKTAARNLADPTGAIDSELNHRDLSAGGGVLVGIGKVRADLQCSRCRATPSRATACGSCWLVSLAHNIRGVGVSQPQAQCFVCAAGDDALAVRAKRHTPHRASVAGQRVADRFPGVGVPQPHGAIETAGDDALVVRAKRNAQHRVRRARSAGWPIGFPVSVSHSRSAPSGGRRQLSSPRIQHDAVEARPAGLDRPAQPSSRTSGAAS